MKHAYAVRNKKTEDNNTIYVSDLCISYLYDSQCTRKTLPK